MRYVFNELTNNFEFSSVTINKHKLMKELNFFVWVQVPEMVLPL